MFEATTTDGAPIAVRVSFGQSVKAGIGFTIGAALASAVVGFVGVIVWFTVLTTFVRVLLSR